MFKIKLTVLFKKRDGTKTNKRRKRRRIKQFCQPIVKIIYFYNRSIMQFK